MMMNHRLIVSSALASALGLGLVTQASGQESTLLEHHNNAASPAVMDDPPASRRASE